MSSPSSTLIFGFFGLTDGVRVQRHEAGIMVNTYYTTYQTMVACINDDDGMNAEVRVYSPPTAALLPQYTIAFIYAKLYVPAHGHILLEAIHCYPFPGDPNDDDYESHFPDVIPSVVVLYGSIPSSFTSHSNGSRSFPLNVSEYVRDGLRASQTITCVFPAYNARWKKTQPPGPNTSVQVVATCSGRSTTDGSLEVHVQNIMFNNTPLSPTASQSTSPPTKRRKYAVRDKKTPASDTSASALLSSSSLRDVIGIEDKTEDNDGSTTNTQSTGQTQPNREAQPILQLAAETQEVCGKRSRRK